MFDFQFAVPLAVAHLWPFPSPRFAVVCSGSSSGSRPAPWVPFLLLAGLPSRVPPPALHVLPCQSLPLWCTGMPSQLSALGPAFRHSTRLQEAGRQGAADTHVAQPRDSQNWCSVPREHAAGSRQPSRNHEHGQRGSQPCRPAAPGPGTSQAWSARRRELPKVAEPVPGLLDSVWRPMLLAGLAVMGPGLQAGGGGGQGQQSRGQRNGGQWATCQCTVRLCACWKGGWRGCWQRRQWSAACPATTPQLKAARQRPAAAASSSKALLACRCRRPPSRGQLRCRAWRLGRGCWCQT